MSLIVKIMSGENCPDSDSRKSHMLITHVATVQFSRDPETGVAVAHVYFVDGLEPETYSIEGNVYVMNEDGKTVSSFGCSAPYAPPREVEANGSGQQDNLAA